MIINNNSIEIYFSDLKEEVQREIINTFGKLNNDRLNDPIAEFFDDPYKNIEKNIGELLKKGNVLR